MPQSNFKWCYTTSHIRIFQKYTSISPLSFFFYKFIYFWLRWVFIAVHGLPLVVASRGYSLLRCAGFSLQWLLLLRGVGSRCAGFSSCSLQAPERRLSSCGIRAQLLCGMWDLPRPGLEPMSPSLAGGFLTTVPPGKPPPFPFSYPWFVLSYFYFYIYYKHNTFLLFLL